MTTSYISSLIIFNIALTEHSSGPQWSQNKYLLDIESSYQLWEAGTIVNDHHFIDKETEVQKCLVTYLKSLCLLVTEWELGSRSV